MSQAMNGSAERPPTLADLGEYDESELVVIPRHEYDELREGKQLAERNSERIDDVEATADEAMSKATNAETLGTVVSNAQADADEAKSIAANARDAVNEMSGAAWKAFGALFGTQADPADVSPVDDTREIHEQLGASDGSDGTPGGLMGVMEQLNSARTAAKIANNRLTDYETAVSKRFGAIEDEIGIEPPAVGSTPEGDSADTHDDTNVNATEWERFRQHGPGAVFNRVYAVHDRMQAVSERWDDWYTTVTGGYGDKFQRITAADLRTRFKDLWDTDLDPKQIHRVMAKLADIEGSPMKCHRAENGERVLDYIPKSRPEVST